MDATLTRREHKIEDSVPEDIERETGLTACKFERMVDRIELAVGRVRGYVD